MRGKASLISAFLILAAIQGAGPAEAYQAGGKPDAAQPQAASQLTVDRAFMLGGWADDESCRNQSRIRADGTFVAGNGSTGTWRLDGDRLTLTGRNTLVLRILPFDRNRLVIINPDGTLGRSWRCS